jgi:acetylornithine/N-succinyldiaminopimelate aminotransferase
VILEQLKKLESKVLLATYDRYPVLLRKGSGVYVYDHKGRRYLDFLSGIGVNALGYGHPSITKTMARQAKLLVHTSNLFYNEYQGKLAAVLTRISGMDRAFFTNSGTEAWEAAMKVARAYAKANAPEGSEAKWRFLVLEHAFHGRTFGSVSATHKEKYRLPFEPVVPGVEFVKFNDIADLEKKFDSSVCAIGFEFVQGEGGIRPVSREFAQRARELATANKALLIADEIQSGLGRTGKWFAYQHYVVKPDMVTLAKPLAGGLPLGALLVTEDVAGCIHPGMHGTTFGGGPLTCAVALQVIKVIERQKILKHAQQTGDYMVSKLQQMQRYYPAIKEVRGMGLMIGLDLASPELAKKTFQHLLDHGVIINRTDETVIRMLPPLIIKKKHADEVLKLLDQVLGRREAVSAGTAQGRNK